MPTDRKDLEDRLAAATPQDTVRGLIFVVWSEPNRPC